MRQSTFFNKLFRRLALTGAALLVLFAANAQTSLEMRPQFGKMYLLKSEGSHAIKQYTTTSTAITSQVVNLGVLMQNVANTPTGSVFQLAIRDIEATLQGSVANVTFNSAAPDSTTSLAHQVMARYFKKIMMLRPVVTFAKDGSVSSLTGFDSISLELEKTFPNEAAIIALVTGSHRIFTEQGFKEFLEQSFKVYPDGPVKDKGSWKTDVKGSMMGIPSELKNTYKVQTMDDQKVTVGVASTVKMQLPQALTSTASRAGRGQGGGGMRGMDGGGFGGGMGGGGGMRGGGGGGGGMRGGGGGGFGGGMPAGGPSPAEMAQVVAALSAQGIDISGLVPPTDGAVVPVTPGATGAIKLSLSDSIAKAKTDSLTRVALRTQQQITRLRTTIYALKGKQTGTVTFDLKTGFPVSSDLSIATKGTLGVEATALPVEYFGTIKNTLELYKP